MNAGLFCKSVLFSFWIICGNDTSSNLKSLKSSISQLSSSQTAFQHLTLLCSWWVLQVMLDLSALQLKSNSGLFILMSDQQVPITVFQTIKCRWQNGQSHIICCLKSSVFLSVNAAWTRVWLKESVPVTSPALPVTLQVLDSAETLSQCHQCLLGAASFTTCLYL